MSGAEWGMAACIVLIFILAGCLTVMHRRRVAAATNHETTTTTGDGWLQCVEHGHPELVEGIDIRREPPVVVRWCPRCGAKEAAPGHEATYYGPLRAVTTDEQAEYADAHDDDDPPDSRPVDGGWIRE